MDIAKGRLSEKQYAENFKDMHAPLVGAAVLVEADRCYYCYDAPCTTACPTGIDVAGFIRNIASQNTKGAAQLILKENIFGGTCGRVCPTETLCEEACVRNDQDDKPVEIGLLQRFAVDQMINSNEQLFTRAAETGKRIALIGAGPASLSCAHNLSQAGHSATIYEAKEKSGGLNEYGLASYKMTENFASLEIDYILEIGGIDIKHGMQLGRDISLNDLLNDYDAVFLGMGLGDVNRLGLDNENVDGVLDAVDYIASLRQSDDLADVEVGRNIVVIGGGMTAIDIATQCKLLGAENVTIAYRRSQSNMKASLEEQMFTKIKGVSIKHNAMPHRLLVDKGHVSGVEFESTVTDDSGNIQGEGELYTIPADMVFKAIGQVFIGDDLGTGCSFDISRGRIDVNDERRTSNQRIWAGGDCISGGDDLTVSAVQDGKLAAYSICEYLNKV